MHRWTDPTFLAGLALLEAHWNAPRCVFELACGIGHYLRELQRRGFAVAGGDVVFAKLWVARHWVLGPTPPARLLRRRRRLADRGGAASTSSCATTPSTSWSRRTRSWPACARRAGDDGWLAVSHIHNRDNPGFSAGSAMTAGEVEELFPDALVYDDAELTRALVEARAPVPATSRRCNGAEAFSVIAGPGCRPAPRAVKDGLALPPAGARLRRNPLYQPVGGDESAIRVAVRALRAGVRARAPPTRCARTRRSEAVAGPEVEAMARRRELVDLPERW